VTLSLPENLETFGGFQLFHTPAVYALVLDRPDDVGQAWDREFDTRPDWFEEFRDAREVWYVGATNDCLSRLEGHRDGEVRVGVLQRICEVESLRNVWWFDTTDRAFERESGIAVAMQNEYPDVFIHQR